MTLASSAKILSELKKVETQANIIDSAPMLGLLGTPGSLSYRVHEIEKHFHNNEKWFGISADQTGENWASSVSASGMPAPFVAISGAGDYGADSGDEAKLWGLSDTIGTNTKMDFHEIFVTAASVTSIFYLRFIYGSGTMAEAITAGQFTEFPIIADAAVGGSIDTVLLLMMPRITLGVHRIWAQAKNTTNNATISMLVGAHGYIA